MINTFAEETLAAFLLAIFAQFDISKINSLKEKTPIKKKVVV